MFASSNCFKTFCAIGPASSECRIQSQWNLRYSKLFFSLCCSRNLRVSLKKYEASASVSMPLLSCFASLSRISINALLIHYPPRVQFVTMEVATKTTHMVPIAKLREWHDGNGKMPRNDPQGKYARTMRQWLHPGGLDRSLALRPLRKTAVQFPSRKNSACARMQIPPHSSRTIDSSIAVRHSEITEAKIHDGERAPQQPSM